MDQPPGRMRKARERRRAVEGERKRQERQRRGEARPDGEGERVDLARGLGDHVAGSPEEGREHDQEERSNAGPADPVGADDRHSHKGDRRGDRLHPFRPLAQRQPGQENGEIDLQLITSDESPTGKPWRIAMNSTPNWPTPIRSP